MNQDLHHGMVHTLSRWAGLTPEQAYRVSNASQFIDDNIGGTDIKFSNGNEFKAIRTCMSAITVDDFKSQPVKDAWLCHHFLPASMDASYRCQKGSKVAYDMMTEMRNKFAPDNLEALGAGLHTFCDTWSHQGFSGVVCNENKATTAYASLLEKIQAMAVYELCALGHGTVLHYPDYPYMQAFTYTYNNGESHTRDNSAAFIEAADESYKQIQMWVGKVPVGLTDNQKALLLKCMLENKYDDSDPAYGDGYWQKKLAGGTLTGQPETMTQYDANTKWLDQALNGIAALDKNLPVWNDNFTKTSWYNFFTAANYMNQILYSNVFPENNITF